MFSLVKHHKSHLHPFYFRKLRKKSEIFLACKICFSNTPSKHQTPRYSPIQIQMLSSNLHKQIFSKKQETDIDSKTLEKVISHLSNHGLWGVETSTLPDVDFKIPPLHNSDVLEHFHHIASEMICDYKALLDELLKANLPPIPKNWSFSSGWTQYDKFGKPRKVDFPEENALIFDVEVCMQEGNYPTLASAVSNKHWYLWCSEKLVEDNYTFSNNVTLSDLIPMETQKSQNSPPEYKACVPKIIVGHNVAFDRTFIKEQYYLERTKLTFLDTMSLHICVSGLTGMQRALSLASKKKSAESSSTSFLSLSMGWSHLSSLNNLADVFNFYCDGKLNKSEREVFISGSLADIRENFQELATYCAQDAHATFQVLRKLFPLFLERFPHPVTLCGLLEMTSAYLPVNHNWNRYISETQSTYDDLQKELKLSLVHLANDACSLLHNDLFREDPWLWDLDWSVQSIKFKKETKKTQGKTKKKKISEVSRENENSVDLFIDTEEKDTFSSKKDFLPDDADESLKHIYETAMSLRKVRPFLPGYPAWYRELCDKNGDGKPDWEPGPYLISTQMRCVPKLMRMTWDGFPLHYDDKQGWGYLIPNINEVFSPEDQDFPIVNFLKLLETRKPDLLEESDVNFLWSSIQEPKENSKEMSDLWNSISSNYKKEILDKIDSQFDNGPFDVGIKGCLFYRLPHKDGPHKRVGNPLSKDFLTKVEDGTLKTWGKGQADRALILSKMLSYWKNAHARIMSQMVVWLNNDELSEYVKSSDIFDESGSYGAILPRLIPAGTVTRRAVEPTWLTASNAYEDRVGSELKSMIQAPPGYHFVGADVDSQELWLAAIFGDSQFVKLHGCTAFGWMTLQGKKSAGTDMHSKTAASVGISRDQAKILNYARIYGAGKSFAQRLLMQFNHRLTLEEAKKKVNKIYSETKGVQKYINMADENDKDGFIFMPGSLRRFWVGGSESHMFNKLEEIALSKKPRTPALECRISRALEPKAVDKNFMTSRINWVVQSSAVDFLHLMLVCMKWLFEEFDIKGRYSICIHDEVRYLVKSEDKYRAALALQITNLLTRCFFTAKLDMNDLPQSVAFFSFVDIDTVLRKEVNMDSTTPSNPHGLEKGYGIPPGEALDIFEVLRKTNGCLQPEHKQKTDIR